MSVHVHVIWRSSGSINVRYLPEQSLIDVACSTDDMRENVALSMDPASARALRDALDAALDAARIDALAQVAHEQRAVKV